MSKERLEEIRNRMIVEKQHFKYLNSEKGYWENVYTLLEQDMKYLFDTIIEQAERVQELENVNRVLKKANVGSERAKERLREWVDELEMENECYREAIERALGESGWGDERNALYRMIGILTKALES